MSDKINTPEDLNHEELSKLIIDMFHRTIVHHTMWFNEVKHQMGAEKAMESLFKVSEKSLGIQMKRLSKTLGFNLKNGLPEPMLNLERDKLHEFLNTTAINWLANDGLWFQEIEFNHGMNDAKRCNDSCWAQFSPFEAYSIKKQLDLSEFPGLDGLKKALNFRLYGSINTQSFNEETSTSFIFQMNECRVQVARKRKGLDDYPCKSVGLVEYPYFATGIDKRIKTECIGCPPDTHPESWYCAWKFTLE